MRVLYRVFDSDDVARACIVDMVEYGGQRGRFTGTRNTRYDDKPANLSREFLEYGGQVQVVELEDLLRYDP